MLCAIAAPSITVAVMRQSRMLPAWSRMETRVRAFDMKVERKCHRRHSQRSPRRDRLFFDQLEEDLVLPDHSQFAPRTLLDRIEADLEVAHLGVQRLVPRLELAVHLALHPDLSLDLPHAQPAAFAQPEGILVEQYQTRQGEGQEPHRS